MIKHFRFQDLNTIDDSAFNKQYVILDRTPGSDQELINIMGIYDAACNAMLGKQTPAMEKAIELIDLLKKEYHLN